MQLRQVLLTIYICSKVSYSNDYRNESLTSPMQIFNNKTIAAFLQRLPSPFDLHPDAGLKITEMVPKHGYPLESHEVVTEDGYVLTVHRIPHGINNTNQNNSKSPILFHHGLLCSSVDFVNVGPGRSLAYFLADAGFDIWLGNQRGNTWSRNHTQLDPDKDKAEFFNFTFNEIGTYDLPVLIDFILEKTGHEKIFYVGHSQGVTDFLIMASERPDYNNKIKLMVSMSPLGYMEHARQLLLRLGASLYTLFKAAIRLFHIHEFLPHKDIYTLLGFIFCNIPNAHFNPCLWFFNFMSGWDWKIDPKLLPVIITNIPAGGSILQLDHYLQLVKSGNFCQYDLGTKGNMDRYGQPTPPLYNISKITAPVSLYYSDNDFVADSVDVKRLAKELPNLVNLKKIAFKDFNHVEFLWAKDVYELVYKYVIREIIDAN